jgi:WD40 repeat protein
LGVCNVRSFIDIWFLATITHMTDFDPYCEWLNIPPPEQPVTAHRLLGISAAESDVVSIREAALEKVVLVRQYSLGKFSEEAEALLNEIAWAWTSVLAGNPNAYFDTRNRDLLLQQTGNSETSFETRIDWGSVNDIDDLPEFVSFASAVKSAKAANAIWTQAYRPHEPATISTSFWDSYGQLTIITSGVAAIVLFALIIGIVTFGSGSNKTFFSDEELPMKNEAQSKTSVKSLNNRTEKILGSSQLTPDGEGPAENAAAVTAALAKDDWKAVLALDPDNSAGLRMQTAEEKAFAERMRSVQPGIIYSVAFSPNGKTVASGSGNNTIQLSHIDPGTKAKTKTLIGHSGRVRSVAFSPDGTTIASASHDKTIRLWDSQTGAELKTFAGHSSYVLSVTFSPDGKTIASGGADNYINLWDVEAGIQLKSFSGHSERVRSVAFSPDATTIVSGSWDTTIKLWNIQTGAEVKTLAGHSVYVRSVAFSPHGKTIASGSMALINTSDSNKTVKLWDVESGTELKRLNGHSADVWSIAFSPDGKTVASGSRDKTIKLWDIETGAELQTLYGHTGDVTSVAFNPDGETIASGSYDKTVKIWNVNTGRVMWTILP